MLSFRAKCFQTTASCKTAGSEVPQNNTSVTRGTLSNTGLTSPSTRSDKSLSNLHQAKRRIKPHVFLLMAKLHFLLYQIYSVTDFQRHFLRVLGCSLIFFTLCIPSASTYYIGQCQRCHQGGLHLIAREKSYAAPIPRDHRCVTLICCCKIGRDESDVCC